VGREERRARERRRGRESGDEWKITLPNDFVHHPMWFPKSSEDACWSNTGILFPSKKKIKKLRE